ncbi:uncharacterized protein LOC119094145 [Pollicipes pollicipes]|uniref:uncharacterized protein LOC119094145 n=1 Tax=Pollicipes pollicipes TaxID=41117 RepID=UPI00188564D4|nr:uncharacterized protein LOC119094145 [Pollicipes pollicipes]
MSEEDQQKDRMPTEDMQEDAMSEEDQQNRMASVAEVMFSSLLGKDQWQMSEGGPFMEMMSEDDESDDTASVADVDDTASEVVRRDGPTPEEEDILGGITAEVDTWLGASPAQRSSGTLTSILCTMVFLIHRDDTAMQGNVARFEKSVARKFSADKKGALPLPLPVPPSQADCACADLRTLAVEWIYLSGSVREGSDVVYISSKVSDMDLMFQLGPITVLPQTGPTGMVPDQPGNGVSDQPGNGVSDQPGNGVSDQPGSGVSGQAGDGVPHHYCSDVAGHAGDESSQTGVEVCEEPTAHPGFVLLRHQRRPDCRHAGRLLLSGQRVVRLVDGFSSALTPDSAPSHSGPAVSTTIADLLQVRSDFDLVPTGAQHEWRLSFSRHEYMAYRAMSQTQRTCLSVLKFCKALLGEAVTGLKGYYMKTALFWLWETLPAARWSPHSPLEPLLAVLDYLERRLQVGSLPCYFLPEINLWASLSVAELRQLAAALEQKHIQDTLCLYSRSL